MDEAVQRVRSLRERPFIFEREWSKAAEVIDACAKSELATSPATILRAAVVADAS